MSHGAGGGDGVRADPDLTPMLDLVMQLLMYFIMCANFLGQEVVSDVKLPDSQAARPLDKTESEILFVNVNHDGKVIVLGHDPMDNDATLKWLNDRVMDAPKDDRGKPRSTIVIRADAGASYESVYWLLSKCKEKGFSRYKVRAIMKGGG
jgi:biopolymer transport protein ExbD